MNEIIPYRKDVPARMERGSEEQIAILLVSLFALFPQVKVDEALVAAYVERLKIVPLDSLAQAINHCKDNCESFPAVATILKAWREQTAPGPRNDITPQQLAARPDITNRRLYHDPNDTPEGRRERLRRTAKWGFRYGD